MRGPASGFARAWAPGAALYAPVGTNAIQSKADFGMALAAHGLLVFGRMSPALVVLAAAVAGTFFAA